MKPHFLFIAAILWVVPGIAAELRLGIVGCDTSHVQAFTSNLNNPKAKGHVPGARVVAAFKGGSKDMEASWSRVDKFSETLQRKHGVKFYDSIEEVCANVDAILLESVDGRVHLEQVMPVLAARKPVFIDKPMAASLRDVIEIFRLAREAKVPVFSSSALRFATNTVAVKHGSIGPVREATTFGPYKVETTHPDLFWYSIHGIEALYTVLGRGCESVQQGTNAQGGIKVTGLWLAGTRGVYEAADEFHGVAKGEKGEAAIGGFDGYQPLLAEIIKFFQTGVAPVSPEETIEIFAFMEAAETSKQLGGSPVKVQNLIRQNTR